MQKTLLISMALGLSYPTWANVERDYVKLNQEVHSIAVQSTVKGVVKDKNGTTLSGITITNLTSQFNQPKNNLNECSGSVHD